MSKNDARELNKRPRKPLGLRILAEALDQLLSNPRNSLSVAMTGLNPPALATLSFLPTFRARRAAVKCAELETEALLVELVAWETAIHQRVAYPGGESG
jgi:hypothetical protein